MRLDEKAIQEFIQLYENEFGEQLTLDEARAMASELIHLYELLTKPLPGERHSVITTIDNLDT